MMKAREGAIINMSSAVPFDGEISVKLTMQLLRLVYTKSVAREVANANIRVNAILSWNDWSDMTPFYQT